jgi:hypothetical protein
MSFPRAATAETPLSSKVSEEENCLHVPPPSIENVGPFPDPTQTVSPFGRILFTTLLGGRGAEVVLRILKELMTWAWSHPKKANWQQSMTRMRFIVSQGLDE